MAYDLVQAFADAKAELDIAKARYEALRRDVLKSNVRENADYVITVQVCEQWKLSPSLLAKHLPPDVIEACKRKVRSKRVTVGRRDEDAPMAAED